MKALTDRMPKPLLSVLGNNLIEHKLAALPGAVDDIIIVVGYLGDKIKEHFGDSFEGKPIRYVRQGDLMGTAPALFEARSLLHGRFLVMMGDDLYSKKDMKAVAKHPWAILVKKMDKPGKGARVAVNSGGHITDITEGADLSPGDLSNAGLYALGTEIFNYPLVQIPSGEFGLPQTLVRAAKDFNVAVVESVDWRQISTPEDLEHIEKEFAEKAAA